MTYRYAFGSAATNHLTAPLYYPFPCCARFPISSGHVLRLVPDDLMTHALCLMGCASCVILVKVRLAAANTARLATEGLDADADSSTTGGRDPAVVAHTFDEPVTSETGAS